MTEAGNFYGGAQQLMRRTTWRLERADRCSRNHLAIWCTLYLQLDTGTEKGIHYSHVRDNSELQSSGSSDVRFVGYEDTSHIYLKQEESDMLSSYVIALRTFRCSADRLTKLENNRHLEISTGCILHTIRT